MKNIFTCNMRDILLPVMESQGFVAAVTSEDGWILNKKESDKEKKQIVYVDHFSVPASIGLEDRRKILPIAAACGEIFVEKGGEWRWEDTELGPKACAVIPNRNISIFKDYTMKPLDLIYVYINTEFRENICVWISGVLKQSLND